MGEETMRENIVNISSAKQDNDVNIIAYKIESSSNDSLTREM